MVSSVDVRITQGVNAEYNAIFTPTPLGRAGRPNPRGVILLPGASTPDNWLTRGFWPNATELGYRLARNGIPVMAIEAGMTAVTNPWANDASLATIPTARAYMAAQIPGMATDKIGLMGISLGGGTGNRFTSLNTGLVCAWCGLISLASLFPLYALDNPAGARASIATAWGLTNRAVADGTTTNLSPIVGSATMAWVAGDVNGPIQGAGIPAGAVAGSLNSGVSINLAAGTGAVPGAPVNATVTAAGVGLTQWKPLPNSGAPNADILTLSTAIKAAGVPALEFYDSNDPYISNADSLLLAANSGAQIFNVGALGHTDAAIAAANWPLIIATFIAAGC